MDLFLALAPIWRRILDLSREVFCGPIEEEGPSNLTTDNLVGRYVYVDLPHWGRTKLFYEQSGDISKPAIIFLHTAVSCSILRLFLFWKDVAASYPAEVSKRHEDRHSDRTLARGTEVISYVHMVNLNSLDLEQGRIPSQQTDGTINE